jgi:hypothetical protein
LVQSDPSQIEPNRLFGVWLQFVFKTRNVRRMSFKSHMSVPPTPPPPKSVSAHESKRTKTSAEGALVLLKPFFHVTQLFKSSAAFRRVIFREMLFFFFFCFLPTTENLHKRQKGNERGERHCHCHRATRHYRQWLPPMTNPHMSVISHVKPCCTKLWHISHKDN